VPIGTPGAKDLHGVFVAMKHELPAMVAGGGGALVNMSSTAGIQAVAGVTGSTLVIDSGVLAGSSPFAP
jgi:NAD(P)-dependent dehydrogenase (short-subunit alcohol dehydrogenase family)